MKRWVYIILACLLFIPACAKNNGNQQGMGNENAGGGALNISTPEPLYREEGQETRIGRVRNDTITGEENAGGGGQNEVGYFRYNPEHYHNKAGATTSVFIDRDLLARHISELVAYLPNVKTATTLVTDDHVFVGISTKNGKMDRKTVKEARRTAESVTPRYYRVHITTNRKLESQMNDIGMRMVGNHDVEGVKGDLEQLLRKMGDETPPDVNESLYPNSYRQINPQMK
ncbi:hypothetical protein C1X05_03055 [Laceyella sacchari]|jgi:hypothetical protein|uniref:Sporulation lipoprotein YhcN/YlaJ n=1 Tax=Laceyella sediminis TaxID=573074 RepID=A0ABX5ENA7_9BACL|nr:YhcN/YlaJ family sporulation lipoprotein [Laceyella sediminis]AUS07902.1 hypothetical protein C1X05_03055 [Laceyella sacchari]MRG28366.1 hypothetical protein [Laceyella tengchongensis]PRZ13938.1 sporulation lipoprotein YhcN/YlaJ [Laceyella sediminis]